MQATIEVVQQTSGAVRRGRFFMIDLASPQRTPPPNLPEADLAEMKNVPVSLHALGVVLATAAASEQQIPCDAHAITQVRSQAALAA